MMQEARLAHLSSQWRQVAGTALLSSQQWQMMTGQAAKPAGVQRPQVQPLGRLLLRNTVYTVRAANQSL